MKKFILNTLITAIALSGATVALAEDTGAQLDTSGGTGTTVNKPNPLKALMEARKGVRVETREKIQDARDVRASTTRAIREDGKDKMQDLRGKIASTTRENRDERMEDRREKASSTQEKRMERREDRRENLKRKIEERFKKMFERFQATIDRETTIMGKINARISKVKTAGGNTTEPEKFTAEAKTHLDEAQTALNLLKSTATSESELNSQEQATTTDSNPTKGTLEKMKKAGSEVEKHIREAHKALEKAVKSLRGMSRANENASTTTTNN